MNNTSAACEGLVLPVFLIVGLGNTLTDPQDSLRRCNIGFLTLDDLAYLYQTSFAPEEKLHCELSKGILNNRKVVFVKPTTTMNWSGKSVTLVQAHYNVALNNIYVVHDDINLEVGMVRIKTGGQDGGHRGIRSIDEAVGENYHRLRIGVGKPKSREREELMRFTNSTFNETEYAFVKKIVRVIADNVELVLDNKWIQFRAKINVLQS